MKFCKIRANLHFIIHLEYTYYTFDYLLKDYKNYSR
nr:MAG TPA: hypothetical protein [Caudoviricetes sp.]